MSEIDGGEGLSGTRHQMVELAQRMKGVGAYVTPGMYQDLVGGEQDSAQMRRDMLGMSGCALVVRGLWRRLGVKHAILNAPYRLQHAVSDLEEIAHERSAWRDFSTADYPKPGDCVILAKGQPMEHAYTVTAVARMDTLSVALCSIDGGQRDQRHAEIISGFERRWTLRFGQPGDVIVGAVDTVIEVGAMHPARIVSGWIDLDAIMAGQ